jgi:hypothetical protein
MFSSYHILFFYVILFFVLSLCFFVSFFYIIVLIFKNHKQIKREIFSHKTIYLILIFLVILGGYYRFSNIVSEKYYGEEFSYFSNNGIIYDGLLKLTFSNSSFFLDKEYADNNYENFMKFNYPQIRWSKFQYMPSSGDQQSYPVVLFYTYHLFYDLIGHSYSSLTSAIFSTFNIIVIFLFSFVLFSKNRYVALFSSGLICFSFINIHAGVIVRPFSMSLFFTMIFLIGLNQFITSKKLFHLVFLSFILAFLIQCFFVELLLIPIAIIFLVLNSKKEWLIKKSVFLMLLILIPLLFYIPYFVITHHDDFWLKDTLGNERKPEIKLVDYVARTQSLDYSLEYLFGESPETYNGKINYFGPHITQYLSFELLGAENTFRSIYLDSDNDHLLNYEKPKSFIELFKKTHFNFSSVFSFFVIFIGFFYLFKRIRNHKTQNCCDMLLKNKKSVIFVSILFLSFILIFSPFITILWNYLTYAHTLGYIPLLSFFSFFLINMVGAKLPYRLRIILLFIMFVIIVSDFFFNNYNKTFNEFSYFFN